LASDLLGVSLSKFVLAELTVCRRYQGARAGVAVYLNSSDAVVDLATQHGIEVLEFEQKLGIAWEHAIQTWFIEAHPVALEILNRVYSWVSSLASAGCKG
jgi:hypothetical protein